MYKFLINSQGNLNFAVFPDISHRLREFIRAPVRLQVGDMRWGARHIESAHAKELSRLKMDAAAFVGNIVKPGSPIYCEFESMKQTQRAQTVNLRIGTVVLEFKKSDLGDFYTVVTAFSRTKPIGELIGKLE